LCEAVVRGLKKQIDADRMGVIRMIRLGSMSKNMKDVKNPKHEEDERDKEWQKAWDDVTEMEMDPGMVRKA